MNSGESSSTAPLGWVDHIATCISEFQPQPWPTAPTATAATTTPTRRSRAAPPADTPSPPRQGVSVSNRAMVDHPGKSCSPLPQRLRDRHNRIVFGPASPGAHHNSACVNRSSPSSGSREVRYRVLACETHTQASAANALTIAPNFHLKGSHADQTSIRHLLPGTPLPFLRNPVQRAHVYNQFSLSSQGHVFVFCISFYKPSTQNTDAQALQTTTRRRPTRR